MTLILSVIDYNLSALLSRIELRQWESEYLSSIVNDRRKCEWLMSRVLVWERFSQRVDMIESGAPVVEDGYISISHCDGYIAIAYDSSPVGVDVELVDRNVERVVRKFTDANEVEVARAVFDSNPALLVWCAKEAMYKLAGVEGAEFISDFRIVSASGNKMIAHSFTESVLLDFFVEDGILVVVAKNQIFRT